MKNKLKQTLYIIITTITLISCIDDNYGENSNIIVTNLTKSAWERTYQDQHNNKNAKIIEHYEFKQNGKGFIKTSIIYNDGTKDEKMSYFQYLFTTPNFKYLLVGTYYWKIENITSTTLNIYETPEDPLTIMGQTRVNKIFSALPLQSE